MAEVASLLVRVGAETADFNEGMSSVSEGLRNAGERMTSAGKKMTGFVTGPIAALGGGMLALATKTGNYADELLDMEQQTGISTDTLQEFRRVTTEAGVSQDALARASEGLTRRLRGMEDGGGRSAEAMESLGISITDSEGNIRSMDALMPEVITSLQQMENETQRNAIANDLLGRGMKELAPVLGMSAEETQALREEAHEMGLVMGTDALQSANAFRKEMDGLKQEFGVLFREVAMNIIPIFQDTLLPLFRDNLMPVIMNLAGTIGTLFEWFSKLDDSIQVAIVAATAIAAALGPVLLIAGQVATALAALAPVAAAAGKAIALLATPAGPILLLVGVLGVLMATSEDFRSVVMEVFNQVAGFISDIWGRIQPILQDFGRRFMELMNVFIEEAQGFLAAVEPVFNRLPEVVGNVMTILEPFIQTFENILEGLLLVATKVFEGIIAAVEPFQDVFMSMVNIIMDGVGLVAAIIDEDWSRAWEFAGSIFENFDNLIVGILDTLVAFIEGMIGVNIVQAVEDGFTWVENFIDDTWNSILDFTQNIWNSIVEFFTNTWNSISDLFNSSLNTIDEFIFNTLTAIHEFITETWDTISNFFVQTWENITAEIIEKWEAIKTFLSDTIMDIWRNIEERFNEVKDFLTGLWGDISTLVSETWEEIKTSFREAIDDVVGFVVGLKDDVIGAFRDMKNDVLGFAGEIVSGGINAIKNAAADVPLIGRLFEGNSPDIISQHFMRMAETSKDAASEIRRNTSRMGRAIGGNLPLNEMGMAGEGGTANIGGRAGGGLNPVSPIENRTVRLEQTIQTGARPEDVERITRRSLRQFAVNWDIEENRLIKRR